MDRELKVEPSEDLAYWIGVVQSDGCFYKYIERGRRKHRYLISLDVSKKSVPMLIKFVKLSEDLFKRKVSI